MIGLRWMALPMALALIAGCTTALERELSHQPPKYAALPNGHDPLQPTQLSPLQDVAETDLALGIIPYFEQQRGLPLQILQLSGGGQWGAFGAGFLTGWREHGDRPTFDIVTGVSAGALMATHAFLGTPADDEVLEQIFTHTDKARIYTHKPLLGLLFGGNSFYDTAPLQATLDKYITADTLRRVAEAFDDNRRLWVGTTNLDYDQTWVWNMTLIAKQGDLELYKKVLRASASPPVAFPPVEIDGYLFGDGGVRENLVPVGLTGNAPPPPPRFGPGNVYMVINSKQKMPSHAVRNDILGVASGSISAMLSNSMDTPLLRSYIATRAHGYAFQKVAVPEDADVGDNPLAFDPQQMRVAFDLGHRLGQSADPWSTAPPLVEYVPGWALDLLNPQRQATGDSGDPVISATP